MQILCIRHELHSRDSRARFFTNTIHKSRPSLWWSFGGLHSPPQGFFGGMKKEQWKIDNHTLPLGVEVARYLQQTFR